MSNSELSLAGRWALVTGASRGIGRAVAMRLALAGANVIVTARLQHAGQDALAEVAEAIRDIGPRAEVIHADLARMDDVASLAQRALAIHTPIHILVHVAGVVYPASALEQTIEEWDATLAVNLKAPFFLSQALAPAMIEAGEGRIIMIGSAAGIVGFADRAAYASSKGGLAMLVRQLAVEWGPKGICVNCVAPTVTMTEMARAAWSDEAKRETMLARIPTRRFAEPEDVAQTVAFLATPAASMLNGLTLPVDGGYTIQ